MTYQTPKPLNKSELRADFAKYEKRYPDQSKTLSQFVEKQVVNAWDVALLNESELLVLKENTEKKPSVSLVIFEVKN